MATKRKRENWTLAVGLVVAGLAMVLLGFLFGNFLMKVLTGGPTEPVLSIKIPAPEFEGLQSNGQAPAQPRVTSTPQTAPAPTVNPPAAPPQTPPPVTTKPVTPQQTATSVWHRVWVGFFSSRAEAEQVMGRLREKGMDPYMNNDPARGEWWLQIGAFQNAENAQNLANDLRGQGFPVIIR